MRISVAQIESVKGDIANNIIKHKKVINLAIKNKVEVIVFPELSLTGYEPTLAKKLAINEKDNRLKEFQEIANTHSITIGLGAPTQNDSGICISLIVFQPNKAIYTYSKKYLHPDEENFFVSGKNKTNRIGKENNIALAICYEIFVPEHPEKSLTEGVDVYIASVAKGKSGVDSAKDTLPKIAKKYSVSVLMSNAIGLSDNFVSSGGSLILSNEGEILTEFSNKNEGIMIIDIGTKSASKVLLS